jgi:hypothetical protein
MIMSSLHFHNTSIPQYVFMGWYSLKHRGNFTFTKMEVTDQIHGPAHLPLGKSGRYPLDRTQSRSESGGAEKHIPAPTENRTSDIQPVV